MRYSVLVTKLTKGIAWKNPTRRNQRLTRNKAGDRTVQCSAQAFWFTPKRDADVPCNQQRTHGLMSKVGELLKTSLGETTQGFKVHSQPPLASSLSQHNQSGLPRGTSTAKWHVSWIRINFCFCSIGRWKGAMERL